jgi:prepilin-type N-terminal cleavage/methylation domain-containing protein
MSRLKHTNAKGFTLVETLVAIVILLLVVIGPITVAQKGIQNAYFANERVTATFLAQEAIEGIRKYRDDLALNAWDSETTTNTTWTPSCTSSCAYVIESNTLGTCGNNNACRLRFDTTDYLYTHVFSAESISPFTRIITIGGAVNDGRQLTVDVSWSGRIYGGAVQHVILETWIYDHYQRFETD